jgi:tetratricopeptide (TPR) repeat protein
MTTTAYRTLFQDYLGAGLQLVLAQVQAAEPLVPDDLRRQAWHLLSYAFESDAAWPLARDLLLALAPKMEQAGFRDEWIVYLEQGVRRSQLLGDRVTAAECQLHIGHLHRLVSRFDQARQWLAASVEGFAVQGDQQGQARALNQLAYVECLQHQYSEAGRLAEQALALLAVEDPERAMSFFVQGMIAIDHERWLEAETLHRQSLVLREKQGDRRRIAWSLQNLGYALRGQEKYDEGILIYLQAASILYELVDMYNWAHVQMNLGLVYRLNGQPNEALTCHLQTNKFFHKVGDKLNLAKTSTNLGLDYLAVYEWQKAEQAFMASINIYKELGDESWRLNAVDGLAIAYLEQKLYSKAITTLETALTTLPQIADSPNYTYLLHSLTSHLRQAQQGQEATVSAASY